VKHYVEIQRPGRPPERHALDRDLLWLGSAAEGAFCERELAASRRYEAELVPDGQGIRVETAPEATLQLRCGGVVLTRALVRWGESVSLGEVELSFISGREPGVGRGLGALALAAALLGVLAWSFGSLAPPAKPLTPALPELEDIGIVACTAPAVGAEARAFEAERFGVAKRERYAFDARDGLAALPLFREAATCFRDAGRLEDARRARAAADELREHLESDRALLHLALHAAERAGRPADALALLRKLEALTPPVRAGQYRGWLAAKSAKLQSQSAYPHKTATP
jgi:hypothetical protein